MCKPDQDCQSKIPLSAPTCSPHLLHIQGVTSAQRYLARNVAAASDVTDIQLWVGWCFQHQKLGAARNECCRNFSATSGFPLKYFPSGMHKNAGLQKHRDNKSLMCNLCKRMFVMHHSETCMTKQQRDAAVQPRCPA